MKKTETINDHIGAEDKTIELICILDRSGSMYGMESAVIDGFNEFVGKQRAEEGNATLTLVLFDDKYEIVHDEIPLEDVPTLTQEVYYTRGMTAMNDAVGKALTGKNKRNANNLLVMIQTDGMENASVEYRHQDIKKMITSLRDYGSEFIFIGSDISENEVAEQYGISINNTINIRKDANFGTGYTTAVNDVSTAYRSAKVSASSMSEKVDLTDAVADVRRKV